jgi:hypothetical protein
MDKAAAVEGISVNSLVTGMMWALVKQHEAVLARNRAYRSMKKTALRRMSD